MEQFYGRRLEKSFQRFERAAAKGHEESIWITSVVNSMELEKSALIEAFAKTEEPMGCYFAGKFSNWNSREGFDFYKKSAEAGCSWGQVGYGVGFRLGEFVEKDEKVYVEWLEKAANRNNPQAMDRLGNWFRDRGGHNKEKALLYYRAAAELGWKNSMDFLARMLRDGEGCVNDLSQAVVWDAQGSDSQMLWTLLGRARGALASRATEYLDCNFDQVCYSLGWGLYWYHYRTWH
jgi:TPR repeat protein